MDDGEGYYKQCRYLPKSCVESPKQNHAAAGWARFGFVCVAQHDSRCWEKSNSPEIENHVENKLTLGIRTAPFQTRAL